MNKKSEALVITTDMNVKLVLFTADDAHIVLHDEVEGFIERVQLPALGVDMWLNENGKNIGLPQNNFATFLFEKEHKMFDSIRGNVVFTGKANEKGETLGLTDLQIKKLLAFLAQINKIKENAELTDEQNANCRRHGGVANIINCWECSAEFKDDDNETEEDEEDET